MFVVGLLCVALSGCISTTKIYSKPSGATVVIDDTRLLGETPIELEQQVWLWTSHSLTFIADGYVTQTVALKNTGIRWAHALICLCTAGLVFPTAMASTYPEQVVVEMTPLGAAPTTAINVGAISFR